MLLQAQVARLERHITELAALVAASANDLHQCIHGHRHWQNCIIGQCGAVKTTLKRIGEDLKTGSQDLLSTSRTTRGE
jgi:hypothetical protein